MEWLIGIASFLGGALMTAVGFQIAYSDRLAKMETNMTNMCDDIKEIKGKPRYCPLHDSIEKRVAHLENGT